MSEIIRAPLEPSRLPPKPIQTTVLGLTVGTLTTPPALCAVRYVSSIAVPGDPLAGELPIFTTRYHVLGAETMPLDTSIPAIAARVNTLAKRLYQRDARGDYHVLCDASEVGRPIVDAIRFAIIPEVHVTGVTVTPTTRPDPSILYRSEATVGAAYLVSRLQAILQDRRLAIPDDPALADLLALLQTYNAANGEPDLVRALALACSSEYRPVMYDIAADDLPSAAY